MTEETLSSDHLMTNKKQRRKALPSQCKICEGPALYSYYGVIVCSACKVFFRRNNQNRQVSFNIYIYIILMYLI